MLGKISEFFSVKGMNELLFYNCLDILEEIIRKNLKLILIYSLIRKSSCSKAIFV